MSRRKLAAVIIAGGVFLLAVAAAILFLIVPGRREDEEDGRRNSAGRQVTDEEEKEQGERIALWWENWKNLTKEESTGRSPKEPEGESPKEPEGESPKEPEGESPKEPDRESPKEPEGENSKKPEGESPKKPDRENPEKSSEPEGEKGAEAAEPGEPMAPATDSLYYGPLQVIGTSLCDGEGNPVQLKGVSTHGLAWFPGYVNEAFFQELQEQWNANVIRLAMYTAESGGYCTGGDREQLKQLIKDGVGYAADRNMYVIVDWHILSDGNPNTYKEEAKAFFAEMSEEFADLENVLYEICNEPNGGTSWSQVKEYAEEIIPVIRENDEDAVILVGTPNWCQYVDQAAADPITGWDNIMYTLHFYAATHKESLRQTMVAALDEGLPLFVSEYSICDASGNGGIDEAQAEAWVELLNQYGISYVAWNLSNKEETSALFKSSCSKTNGFSENDLSGTGRWLYGVLTGGQGSLPDSPLTGGSQNRQPSDSQNQGQSQGQGQQAQEGGGQQGISAAAAEDLQATVQMVNSWESGGEYFYQYEMTVENISDHAIDGWSADVVFNEAPKLSDSWNGSFVVEGNILHISSVDYNGKLDSGASAQNVGFIVSGSGSLSP